MGGGQALNGPQESVAAMNEQFERRRDFVVERLRAIPDLTCSAPGGAFYAFPDASAYYGRTLRGQTIEGSVSLAEYLLEEGLISLVPGEAFGADDYLRLSFAASMKQLEEGLNRLEAALS